MKESEFGKGFVYNIMLFAKHYERFRDSLRRNNEMAEKYPDTFCKGKDDLWFNGAGDHFYEFEIPEQFKKTKIGKLAMELQDEALDRRLNSTTQEEFALFQEKLEILCILIDKKLGVKPIKATYK